MAPSKESKPLNIAVVGGGMGGLCLTIGLLKHTQIHVEIYEAAHHFSEIGAGVAFGPNAQRALRLIGDNTEQAYLRQVSHNTWKEFKNTWFEFRYGFGPDEWKLIAAPKNETGQSTLHRAKFLDELVSLVPKEIAHFGKRLDQVEDRGAEGVHLHFKDGTTTTADCVIGADGVHSVIRSYLLGKDHPATNAVFTGSVAYRGLIPMDVASEALGERIAQNSFILTGKGGCIMIYPIDFGKTMNIVAINSSYEKWEGPWVVPADYSKIEKEFADWGPHAKAIIKLLDRPETSAWSIWDHPPAPTYCRGNIAMLGDAAHASTPFQGQGAGQAIEDALVLENLLGLVDTPDKVPFALQAYDRIRRPRSTKVCATSRESGELCAMRFPGVMDDAKAFRHNIDWRMDWMWNRDIALERDQAIKVFRKLEEGGELDPEFDPRYD